MFGDTRKVKLFIDDLRDPPVDGSEWTVARSSGEAIYLITRDGWPSYISFDHDLGGHDTAMFVVRWMSEEISSGRYSGPFPEYYVHSQNPIGRKNIQDGLDSIKRYLLTVCANQL